MPQSLPIVSNTLTRAKHLAIAANRPTSPRTVIAIASHEDQLADQFAEELHAHLLTKAGNYRWHRQPKPQDFSKWLEGLDDNTIHVVSSNLLSALFDCTMTVFCEAFPRSTPNSLRGLREQANLIHIGVPSPRFVQALADQLTHLKQLQVFGDTTP